MNGCPKCKSPLHFVPELHGLPSNWVCANLDCNFQMRNYGQCKDCRHWDKGTTECDAWVYTDSDIRQTPSDFSIQVKALDDHGVFAHLKTGPDFGCIKFQVRRV